MPFVNITDNLNVTEQLAKNDAAWSEAFCRGYDNVPSGPLREIDFKPVYKLKPSEQAQLFGEWLRRVSPDYFENPMPLESIRYVAEIDKTDDPLQFNLHCLEINRWLNKMDGYVSLAEDDAASFGPDGEPNFPTKETPHDTV